MKAWTRSGSTRASAADRNSVKLKIVAAFTAAAFGLVAACSDETPSAPQPGADFVFTNASVYTVNPDQPWAEAVVVDGNQITYVGDAAGAESHIGENTDVRDLNGGMILPGFVSGHDHLVSSSWTNAGVNLVGSESAEEALERIRVHAEQKSRR